MKNLFPAVAFFALLGCGEGAMPPEERKAKMEEQERALAPVAEVYRDATKACLDFSDAGALDMGFLSDKNFIETSFLGRISYKHTFEGRKIRWGHNLFISVLTENDTICMIESNDFHTSVAEKAALQTLQNDGWQEIRRSTFERNGVKLSISISDIGAGRFLKFRKFK